MNTNMTGLDGLKKYLIPRVWTKVVSVVEGLTGSFTDPPCVEFTPGLVLN